MAKKGFQDTAALCSRIVGDARAGVFAPVYLLMGEEAYYPDKACEAIMAHALTETERDFNQTVFYGLDTDAGTVASEARSYPMMTDRRLVVLKEAQSMKSLEELAVYCQEPMETTVLVILMHGASADKRKALYKAVSKNGIVLESEKLRDYELDRWITSYYKELGMSIAPDAAALLAEYAGNDLGKIALETTKMLKNLPEGSVAVTSPDIEKNIGISRQYSIFELTKELSYRNAPRALKIARYLGESPKFAMPAAVAMLHTHFYRILKYEALLLAGPDPDPAEKARVLSVNPYFFKEYEEAARNYPLRKAMSATALLEEYDYKGKGGDGGSTPPADLLVELVVKLLNL